MQNQLSLVDVTQLVCIQNLWIHAFNHVMCMWEDRCSVLLSDLVFKLVIVRNL